MLVRGLNFEKSFKALLLCIKFFNFRFQYSIPIGRCRYLSSCVKSTIDIRFLTLFTDMYMKTHNFFGI